MFKCPACNGKCLVTVTHNIDGSLCDLPTTDTCPTCNGTGETADDLSDDTCICKPAEHLYDPKCPQRCAQILGYYVR